MSLTAPGNEPAGSIEIAEIAVSDTYALRRLVLRDGRPDAVVMFAEDGLPGVMHLGAHVDGRLAAISTWIPRAHGAVEAAVQLRGMATAPESQGRGLAGALVETGCRQATAAAVQLVWARARDSALGFYLRHGFDVEGDGFVDEATQLPHHLVVRRLG